MSMNIEEMRNWTVRWAHEAARHSAKGDQLRVQQNENYFRRMVVAHVPGKDERDELTNLRREAFQRAAAGGAE